MSRSDDIEARSSELKPLQLFLVVIIAVAFIGFFIGTQQGTHEPHTDSSEAKTTDAGNVDDAPKAPSYGDLLVEPLAANRHWEEAMDELRREQPGLFDSLDDAPGDRSRALEGRVQHRAYPGAPPTVPHPVKQIGDLACSACHTAGIEVRGRTATPMSHDFMQNCTQCHVSSAPPSPLEGGLDNGPPIENEFAH